MSDLVRYNKRIKRFIDIEQEFTMKTLQIVFGAEICVNTSTSSIAKQFTSNVGAKHTAGFNKKGATSRQAEFFGNVVLGKISTKKTALQLYYDLVGLQWRGEGYGLSYYPKVKQTEQCGSFMTVYDEPEGCSRINMPKKVLDKLDTINRYAEIITDNVFSAHAAIALRKQCTLIADLSYEMEFFGRGSLKEVSQ
ncbi:MAG TPA: hypothetical protein ENH82_16275 [bacterium]|nr:hypothetical protein [bacterium]